MSVTHQDVIDYLKDIYNSYTVQDGKLNIIGFVPFCKFKFRTLPSGMVFEGVCDLDGSSITSLPDDIVVYNHLYAGNIKNITIPSIGVRGNLYTVDSGIKLGDGIYIGCYMYTSGSRYEYLNDLYINGYIFSTGVLS